MADQEPDTNVEFEDLIDAIKKLRTVHNTPIVARANRRRASRHSSGRAESGKLPTRDEALVEVRQALEVLSEHPYNQPKRHSSRNGLPPAVVAPMRRLLDELLRLKALHMNSQETNTQKARLLLVSVIKAFRMNDHPLLDTLEDTSGPAVSDSEMTLETRFTRTSIHSNLNVQTLVDELCGGSEDEEDEVEDDEDTEQEPDAGEGSANAGDSDDAGVTRGQKRAKAK